jgi:hypothetical protein
MIFQLQITSIVLSKPTWQHRQEATQDRDPPLTPIRAMIMIRVAEGLHTDVTIGLMRKTAMKGKDASWQLPRINAMLALFLILFSLILFVYLPGLIQLIRIVLLPPIVSRQFSLPSRVVIGMATVSMRPVHIPNISL